ncbi:MAG TPA: PDZ domain-containing protein [Opitutaceae bacterium]|jgi:C-terminal processing protease CtpA/Prc
MKLWAQLRTGAIVLSAAINLLPAVARGGESVVTMPEFRVLAEFMSIGFRSSLGGEVVSAEITEIAKGSPADRRGMIVGDELIAVDGIKIEGQDYSDLREQIERDLAPGESVRLTFERTGTITGRAYQYVFTIVRSKP